jgi:hypothetical protein
VPNFGPESSNRVLFLALTAEREQQCCRPFTGLPVGRGALVGAPASVLLAKSAYMAGP